MRVVLPGKPQAKLQAVCTAQWEDQRLVVRKPKLMRHTRQQGLHLEGIRIRQCSDHTRGSTRSHPDHLS